ncbi:MAG TPA: hypothetical protein VGA39_03980, partial [Candidatus Acidoferrales bacterium]
MALAIALPVYAHDPTPILILFGFLWLFAGALATGAKYMAVAAVGSDVRFNTVGMFLFVGVCEMGAMVVGPMLLFAAFQMLG